MTIFSTNKRKTSCFTSGVGCSRAVCADAQKALENPTPEAKQEALRLLVEQIIVEDDAITIKHIIPTDESCRLLPRHISRRNVQ